MCVIHVFVIIMSIIEIAMFVILAILVSYVHVLATEGDLIMLLWLWQQGWSLMTTWFIVLLIPG